MSRILVVDDDAMTRDAFVVLLEANGFEAVPCEHGQRALEEARKQIPDLILSDILMPVMDGFELCRLVKSDPHLQKVPLIFCTATYTEPEEQAFALSLGAEGFLLKSADPKVLISMIRNALTDTHRSQPNGPQVSVPTEVAFLQERGQLLFAKLEQKIRDLESSKQLIDNLMAHSPALIYIVDREGRFLHLNHRLEVSMRHPMAEILGQRRHRFIPEDIAEAFEANDQQVLGSGRPITFEETGREPDGEHVYFTVKFPLFDETGQAYAVCGISTDITERKRLERDLQHLSDLHRMLYQVNRAIRTCRTEEALFEATCQLCIEHGSLDLARIGWVPEPGKPFQAAFAAGPLTDYLHGLEIHLAPESAESQGPSGTCIREARVVVCQDWRSDPRVAPWRTRAAAYGIVASASLPLFREGQITAVLTLYSRQEAFFTEGRLQLLNELAEDLSFAIDNLAQARKRAQAEQALVKRELEYRAAFEQSAMGMAQFSLEGRFLKVNARFGELLGYTPTELEGHHTNEFTHPEDQPLSQEQLDRILSLPDARYRFQKRYLHKDGAVIWVEVTGVPVRGPEGPVLYLLSTYEDITERRQAELRLQEEQHRLQALLQTIPDLVWLKDMDGVYRFCNPRFEAFFGQPSAAIVGKSDYDFMDRELADFSRTRDRIALANGKPTVNEEWVTYASDGHRELLETIKTPMTDMAGHVVGVLGIARDVTQSRRDQDTLRKLSRAIEQSPFGVVITDPQGLIEYVNPAFVALSGFALEESLGHNPRILKSGITPAQVYEHMWATLKSGEVWRGELQNRRKDGGLFWTALSIAPVLDESGKVTHFVAFHESIQARKEAEEAVRINEFRYRNLFNSMKEGFALHELIQDENGQPVDYRFLEVNPSFEELTTIPRSEWIGRTVREVLPGIEPRWVQIYAQVVLTGNPAEFEEFAAPLNRWFHVFAFRPTDRQFAVLVHDITERKRSEESLKAQLEELRRWHQLTLDREARIVSLKAEANRLSERLGEPSPYPSAMGLGAEGGHS